MIRATLAACLLLLLSADGETPRPITPPSHEATMLT